MTPEQERISDLEVELAHVRSELRRWIDKAGRFQEERDRAVARAKRDASRRAIKLAESDLATQVREAEARAEKAEAGIVNNHNTCWPGLRTQLDAAKERAEKAEYRLAGVGDLKGIKNIKKAIVLLKEVL